MKVSQINTIQPNFNGFISIKNVEKIEKDANIKISRLLLNTNDIYKVQPLKTEDSKDLGAIITTKFMEVFQIPEKEENGINRLFNTFITALSKAEKEGYSNYI